MDLSLLHNLALGRQMGTQFSPEEAEYSERKERHVLGQRDLRDPHPPKLLSHSSNFTGVSKKSFDP